MATDTPPNNELPAYRKLMAWDLARRLVAETYRNTEMFPGREGYGLTSQMRRAAVSVAANLAEGAAKRGSREFRRYLDIVLGSLAELDCLAVLSNDLGYLSEEQLNAFLLLRNRTGKVVWKLYRYHQSQ